MIGISAFVAASFFLSIQLPTIVAYAIRDLGDAAKSAVAIIMFLGMSGTAVVGVGLLLTARLNVHVLMILPAFCFVGTTLCVLAMRRAEIAETFAAVRKPALS
jgi:FHS family L-fucose permease-like MFS transporter